MTQEAVKNFVANAPIEQPSTLVVKDLASFLEKEIPPRGLILKPWVPTAGLCMIHAARGIGKTYVALNVAYAAATGSQFLNWDANRCLVY